MYFTLGTYNHHDFTIWYADTWMSKTNSFLGNKECWENSVSEQYILVSEQHA